MEYLIYQKDSGCAADVKCPPVALSIVVSVLIPAGLSNKPLMDVGLMWSVQFGCRRFSLPMLCFSNLSKDSSESHRLDGSSHAMSANKKALGLVYNAIRQVVFATV